MLSESAELLECKTFREVFETLGQGLVECAVVPVENITVGEIRVVTSLLKANPVLVQTRYSMPVDHVLAGVAGAKLADITSISSHPEALKQCNAFLSSRQGWSVVSGPDTASCIKKVTAEGRVNHAAIGSRRAAMIYGAGILSEYIADSRNNTTTFCLITNKNALRI
jgi:prephenate dehydratase